MGRVKWRQGRSVTIGLPKNMRMHTITSVFGEKKFNVDESRKEQTRTGWLSVVALTLLRPFRAANAKFQTYKRKV